MTQVNKTLLLSFFTLIWLVKGNVMAQSPAQYTFSSISSSDPYADMNGNTIDPFQTRAIAGGKSNTNSGNSLIALGFTFKYLDRNYTHVSFNTDGLVKFDSVSTAAPVGGSESVSAFSSSGSANFIAPFGADMKTTHDGGIYYSVSGTAPFRSFQVNFVALGIASNNDDAYVQLRIYESSNVIEFLYYAVSTNNTSGNFVIGMRSSATSMLYISSSTIPTTATATPFAGLPINNTNLSALSGKIFRFTPPQASVNLSSISTTASSVLNVSSNVTLTVDKVVTVAGVVVNPGANLILASGSKLTVNGDVNTKQNGFIRGHVEASLAINGSGAGTSLAFDQSISGVTNILKNLTLNRTGGSVTVTNDLQIAAGGSLTLTAGKLNLSDTLVLNSTAAGTASVDAIPAANLGTSFGGSHATASWDPINLGSTGKVVVCRYIPSVARRWRFIGTSIRNTNFEDLRKEIFITGAGTGNTAGALNSNGFDATPSNQPGVYSYNETLAGASNIGWTPLTNNTSSLTNQSMVVGKGYRVFVRGDRSDISRLNAGTATQNEVTVNFIGDFNRGNVTMPVTYTSNNTAAEDGWNLVSNPYPSAFSWDAFHDAGRKAGNVGGTNYNNIDATIYIFSAQKNGYISYNAVSNTASDPSFANGIIPSGASFMVKATGIGASMIFREQFKVASTGVTTLYKRANPEEELSIKAEYDSITYDMAVLKYFNGSLAGFDQNDILKMNGADVNLSLFALRDSTLLTASLRSPDFTGTEVIPMQITSTKNGSHKLIFSGGMFADYDVYLVDAFLGKTSRLTNHEVYTFTINSSVAASFGNGRFSLLVSLPGSLPVTFASQQAVRNGSDVNVTWMTASELNNDRFAIEFSTDGINFEPAGEVAGARTTTMASTYAFTHQNAGSGTLYYRIRQIDADGTFSFSPVMVVKASERTAVQPAFSMYPMPATDIINIKYTEQTVFTVTIADLQGKTVKEVTNSPASIGLEEIGTGAYMVIIRNGSGMIVQTEKLIIGR